MIDFNTINNHLLSQFSSIVESWIPGGQHRGNEYVVRNPTRVDHEAKSFTINTGTGIWKDFAGSAGDTGKGPISLYAYINRLEYKAAAEELADRYNLKDKKPTQTPDKSSVKKAWTQILPVPDNAPAAPEKFMRKENEAWIGYPIVKSWTYYNDTGKILGYDVKIILDDGSKEILPLTYCKSSDGETKWKFIHFKGKRPLYNLHLARKLPEAKIIIVEGCKCAEALQNMLDSIGNKEYIVMTWPGGCQSVKNANWTTCKNRHVIIWPDNDRKKYSEDHEYAGEEKPHDEQPGWMAAIDIKNIILKSAASVSIVNVPGTLKPDTWDVADAIYIENWTAEQTLKHINDNLTHFSGEPVPAKTTEELPFRFLGRNEDTRYYYVKKDRRIKAISESSHIPSVLFTLATVEYWKILFPGKYGVDWNAVVSFLLNHKDANKSFDASRTRGRGAWIDKGRIVFHLGDKLLVDNVIIDRLDLTDSDYIYDFLSPITDIADTPASDEDAAKLLHLIEQLFFSDGSHAALLAGFLALAPVCGALEWRPHLWLTGGPGTGKSSVFGKIVNPVIGQFGLFVSLDTTAAGIREKVRLDGMPVIHDEFEGQDQASRANVQRKLELARQSSSSGNTKVIKGSSSHTPREFDPHSMFLFGSTGVNLSEGADESRVSIIELIIPRNMPQSTRNTHWAAMEKSIRELLTPQYCASLRRRSIEQINTIRENTRTFSTAISEKLSEKRAGDQYGAFFAGAYSLTSSKLISLEGAVDFVKVLDFSQMYEQRKEDHFKLLDHILQHSFKIDTQTELSVEEIILRITDTRSNFTFSPDDQQTKFYELLKRNGIRIDNVDADKTKWVMWISNTHGAIARILENSSWPKKWGLILKRLPGSQSKQLMRFIGSPTQATGIPLENVLESMR